MTVLRLETFAPGAALRPADRRREIEAAREMAFRAGYLEGQSAATEAHLSEEGRLTAELVEAVSDARMTNEAARRHVAASLAPAIEALCAALAPSLAAAGLAAEIALLVERALAASPEARPRLRCAPEVAQRLRALFAERFPGAEIEEAGELLPREAQIHWDQGYDHLDLDACVAQVLACVASHLQSGHQGEDDDFGRNE